jgi:ABC-type sugar transport system permease subunit
MATTAREARAREAGPGRPAGRRRRAGRTRSPVQEESRLALRLLLPTVLVLLAVVGYPILRALYLSFFSDARFGTSEFIGFGNYQRALLGTDAADFWAAWRFTTLVTAVTVTLELLIGLAMALIMHRAFRGRGLVRASVLVPWAIPTAITALLWQWMFDANSGVVNALTGADVVWTGSRWPSFFAIVIADVWKTAPFVGLLLLAGLQIIPNELHEAARVDGATAGQRFWRITLPLLRPAILVAVLFRMLDALRIFDLVQIMTGGANDTATLSLLGYQEAIDKVRIHYGSALSVLTFLYIMVCAFAFVKLLGASVVRTQAREVR